MIQCVAVPVETSAPGGKTNAYLVHGPRAPARGADASGTLLVDPAGRTDALDAAVAAGGVAHVAVTHTHPDHVGGIARYARETDATVWCRYGREARFEDATGVTPDRTFRDGARVGPATVLDTPGHAPDHVAFQDDADVLSGDLVFRDTSTYVGSRDGDMRAFLASLRHLRAARPRTLYPGHGAAISTPLERVDALLAHRRERERLVEAAVRGGARTVDEIVDTAYDRDLGDARPLAADAVRAHLDKLAVEARVSWSGERATPR